MPELWVPNTGPQTAFLATTVREVLYGGAVYGGKSEAITILPLRFIQHPKHRAIILRRTRPQLQETIDRTLQLYPSISPGAKWHEAKSRWEFPTGALVQMGHAEHEKDILNFKTFEYNLICFDELTTFTEWQYSFMMLRNRSKSKDLPLWIRSGTNPGDIGHEWVYDRFIKDKEPYHVYHDKVEYDGKWHTIARQFIPSSVYDNAAMDPSQRDEYIAGIVSSMPAEDVAAYLGGDWNQLTGAMFKTPPVLTTAPTLLDGDYFMMRAIDFGISDPTAVLWAAVYPKQNMIDIVSELYLKDTNLDSVAFHIKAREADLKLRPVIYSVSSPEMDHRQAAAENQSINTMLAIKGVHAERANTDTLAGWAKIRELLERRAIRVWPLGDGIHGAPNLLRTLPKLQRNSGPGKNPNEIRPRQDDHCADCLRYLCLAAYELPAAVQPPQVKEVDPSKQDVTFDKMVQELKKQQHKGPWVPGIGEGW